MKVAGMILGIIGGAIDAIYGLLVIFGGAMIGSVAGSIEGMSELESAGVTTSVITGAAVFVGFLILLLAVLGIVGGAIAKKSPIVAGVLMLIAGVLNFFLYVPGWIVAALLIVGGILAIVGASQDKAQVAAPPPAA